MASIKRSAAEKRVNSYGYRREFHTERTPKFFRFAGDIFNTDDKKSNIKVSSLQKSRPVGLGFGERDMFGPDESWDTKNILRYTPGPEYYTN